MLLFPGSMFSQLGNIRVGAGLATIDILGENYSTLPLIYITPTGTIRGGGFSQTQSGIRLEAIMPLDVNERFEVPLGFEYVFFRAREKSVFSETGAYYTTHFKDLAFITLGLNYSVFKFDAFVAKAKLYTGVDARLAIIDSGEIKVRLEAPAVNKFETTKAPSKGNIRLGANFNLGLNGELNDFILVDLKCGVGIMNLIGKNDLNGELLTYNRSIEYSEKKESYVWTFNLAMTLQYKF
jgi:hypothetical protein